MAERIQVELVDDIDGTAAQHTVTFALDGVTYEIDLSERHAQQLRSVFARYIERSRPKERASAGTRQQERQQEREEQDTRQANRQLTEQIRGAAQRTREHRNKKAPQAETPDSPQSAEGAEQDFAPSAEAEQSDQPQNPQQESQAQQETSEQDESRVPAVSLPQFSSAVD